MAISTVLACYEASLITEVTDPRTGIAATEKFRAFLPNAGELKAYCESVALRRHRVNEYRALPKASDALRLPPLDPLTRAPGWMANLLVPKDVPGYDKMVKLAETGPRSEWRWDAHGRGIWVALSWYDQVKGAPASGFSRVKVPTDDELREMYKKPEPDEVFDDRAA